MTPDEYEFWKKVYIAAIAARNCTSDARTIALRAVSHYRELK